MFKLDSILYCSNVPGVLRVSGGDAEKFLHGQCTQNIKGLESGRIGHTFVLTPKGKIAADCYVLRFDDVFWLLTDQSYVFSLLAHLERFIVIQKVVIEDQTSRWPIAELLPSVFLGSKEDLEHRRLVAGIPRFGVDFTEDNLPQETGLHECLHFNKGCYTGQEVVARLHFRGHVNKRLVRVELQTSQMSQIQVAALLFQADDKSCGTMTSVAEVAPGVYRGLIYLPYKFIEEGGTMIYSEGGARLSATVLGAVEIN